MYQSADFVGELVFNYVYNLEESILVEKFHYFYIFE